MDKANDRIRAVRAEFVALWERLAGFWGVSPSAGRVYGHLLSRGERCSAEELMAELKLSRGAVSMACGELVEWGLIVAERELGERRTLWRAEDDLEKVARSIVAARKRREWDPILASLRAWIPELERERGTDAKAFRARLERIEGVVALADGMATAFLEGGALQALGLKALLAAGARRGRKRRGAAK